MAKEDRVGFADEPTKNKFFHATKEYSRAESWQELWYFLGVKKTFQTYLYGNALIPKRLFEKMLSILPQGDSQKFLANTYSMPGNWGQEKGGFSVQEKYRKENRQLEISDELKKASSQYMKNWHAEMKKLEPKSYFSLQHARFKSISGYKFIANKGHKVRNKFEQEVANTLHSIPVDYEYEPLIKISETSMFPDFKIGNLVIECTSWKGESKARLLAVKIQKYEEAGFVVRVVIPENLRSFYKSIENHIISPNGIKSLF